MSDKSYKNNNLKLLSGQKKFGSFNTLSFFSKEIIISKISLKDNQLKYNYQKKVKFKSRF